MAFGKVAEALGRGDHITELEDGEPAAPPGLGKARKAHAPDLGGVGARVAGDEGLGSDPGFDEEDTAGLQVQREGGSRRVEAFQRAGVADGTEEAHDRVEGLSQAEAPHVPSVKRGAFHAPARKGKHLRVEVEPFNSVGPAKVDHV